MTIPQAFELAVQRHQAGRLAEAEAIYRQILSVEPQHGEALHLLGVLAHQAGRSDLAVGLIRRASALIPNDPAVHSNLGEAYRMLGEWDEAVAEYRLAIQLQPDIEAAHNNLGNAMSEQGRLDEAIASFRRAIEVRPGFAEAHNNLGNALKAQGRVDEAIAAYRQALEIRPDYATAYNNLGNSLSHEGRLDEAIASYRRALELQPSFAEAHNNLGSALIQQGQLDEAIASFRVALQLKPDLSLVHSNLLLDCHYPAELDAKAIFQEHCRWDEVHARPLAKCVEPHPNDPSPERRLRIGYVSPDFREHAVAFFFENLLASHDRGQVEVFCYADLRHADSNTSRLREQAGVWREITGMSDAQAADLIRKDRIDILVDLAGHTAGNRLLIFARQPAPVQVTYLGYCDTTGMQAMDYRLTDVHADPPGMIERLHTERLLRLPETFACFRPSEVAPPVGPLPAQAREQITFASFHALPKLNDRLMEIWVKILRNAPRSRLMLVAAGLGDASCRQRLSEFFGRHGIGTERLEFKGRQSLAQYLALHGEVDVLLDSHPFSGHTVGCHALWMGVPVVTLAGDRHCSRMVASVLTNVGLPELIAQTPGQYVEIATALAADLPRLAALRASLRERMAASPLMDGPRFARHVEAAYRQMWRTWCSQRSSLPLP